MLLKLFKWSDILSSVRDSVINPGSKSEVQGVFATLLESYIRQNFYSFHRILFIRSGSPILNKFYDEEDRKVIDFAGLVSYRINPVFTQPNGSITDNNVQLLIEEKNQEYAINSNILLSNEVNYWKWCKKRFEDEDVKFIEDKTMFEDDIIKYIKSKNIIEEDDLRGSEQEPYFISSLPSKAPTSWKSQFLIEIEKQIG